jgi:hypothetical protein
MDASNVAISIENVVVLVLPVIAFVGDVGAAEGELHATSMISATTRN